MASIWVAHGIMAFLAWAVAAPLAVLAASFRLPSESNWFLVHKGLNLTALLLTLIAVILAITNVEASRQFTENHHIVGLTMAIVVSLQVTSGFLRHIKRDVWNIVHRIMGVILLSMGVWQLQDGLKMIDATQLVPWYWLYFSLFIIAVLAAKVYQRYYQRKQEEVQVLEEDNISLGTGVVAISSTKEVQESPQDEEKIEIS